MILHLTENAKHFSFRCSDAEGAGLPDFAKKGYRGIKLL